MERPALTPRAGGCAIEFSSQSPDFLQDEKWVSHVFREGRRFTVIRWIPGDKCNL